MENVPGRHGLEDGMSKTGALAQRGDCLKIDYSLNIVKGVVALLLL